MVVVSAVSGVSAWWCLLPDAGAQFMVVVSAVSGVSVFSRFPSLIFAAGREGLGAEGWARFMGSLGVPVADFCGWARRAGG